MGALASPASVAVENEGSIESVIDGIIKKVLNDSIFKYRRGNRAHFLSCRTEDFEGIARARLIRSLIDALLQIEQIAARVVEV